MERPYIFGFVLIFIGIAINQIKKVQKSLSTRTHVCKCGYVEDRDINAGINILQRGLSTVGRTESLKLGEFDPLAGLEQGKFS
jgi:transposase